MSELTKLQGDLDALAASLTAVEQIQTVTHQQSIQFSSTPDEGFSFHATGYKLEDVRSLFETVEGRLTAHQDQAYLLQNKRVDARVTENTIESKMPIVFWTRFLSFAAFGLFLAFINITFDRWSRQSQPQPSVKVERVQKIAPSAQ